MKKIFLIMTVALFATVITSANSSFTENFSGGSMPSNMETTGDRFGVDRITFVNGHAQFNGGPDDQRQYLRTIQGDYVKIDFTMAFTYYMNGGGWFEAVWGGMGEGTNDASRFSSPAVPRIGIESAGGLFGAYDGIKLFDDDWFSMETTPAWNINTAMGPNTTQRFHFTYTVATTNMSVLVHQNYGGGAFNPNITSVWSTSSSGTNPDQFDTTDSHIFFGGSCNGSWFDDIVVVVVPEPGMIIGGIALALLAIRRK